MIGKKVVVFKACFDSVSVYVQDAKVSVDMSSPITLLDMKVWEFGPPLKSITTTVYDNRGKVLELQSSGLESKMDIVCDGETGALTTRAESMIAVWSRHANVAGEKSGPITISEAEMCVILGGSEAGRVVAIPFGQNVWLDGDGTGTIYRYKRSESDRFKFVFDGIHARLGLEERTP
jgi:hypothetical protein